MICTMFVSGLIKKKHTQKIKQKIKMVMKCEHQHTNKLSVHKTYIYI